MEVIVLRMSLDHAKVQLSQPDVCSFQHLTALPGGGGQGEFGMQMTSLWNQSGGYQY